MSWGRKEPFLQMETDKMIPTYVFNKTFMVRFPDRHEWENGFQSDRNWITQYKDGPRQMKALVQGCVDVAQGTGLASASGNTPLYSRQKYMLSRHVLLRI
jgi:hypothetical protein